jgi:hypothetical protein
MSSRGQKQKNESRVGVHGHRISMPPCVRAGINWWARRLKFPPRAPLQGSAKPRIDLDFRTFMRQVHFSFKCFFFHLMDQEKWTRNWCVSSITSSFQVVPYKKFVLVSLGKLDKKKLGRGDLKGIDELQTMYLHVWHLGISWDFNKLNQSPYPSSLFVWKLVPQTNHIRCHASRKLFPDATRCRSYYRQHQDLAAKRDSVATTWALQGPRGKCTRISGYLDQHLIRTCSSAEKHGCKGIPKDWDVKSGRGFCTTQTENFHAEPKRLGFFSSFGAWHMAQRIECSSHSVS